MNAAVENLGEALSSPSPILVMLFFMGLSLLPFLLLSVTSFVKLSVVFGILRNALGAQQIPSAALTALMSLVLTVHIMAPVASEVAAKVEKELAIAESPKEKTSGKETEVSQFGVEDYLRMLSRAAEPLEGFLRRHSSDRERVFFLELHTERHAALEIAASLPVNCSSPAPGVPCALEGESFFSLVPAFVISELAEAFAIGFTVFLPFLVLDLLVANLLVGLGMMMVSPVSISLPFKILLFVLCDGWFLLSRGLVLGYS